MQLETHAGQMEAVRSDAGELLGIQRRALRASNRAR